MEASLQTPDVNESSGFMVRYVEAEKSRFGGAKRQNGVIHSARKSILPSDRGPLARTRLPPRASPRRGGGAGARSPRGWAWAREKGVGPSARAPTPSPRGVLGVWPATVGDTTVDRQNFDKMLLVFGCIGTDLCN